jgi:hypothetical protein
LGNAGWRASSSLLSAVTSLPIRTDMSGEPEEDSKPKLNLIINHSGTRTSSPAIAVDTSPVLRDERVLIHDRLRVEVTVKVKANMQFKKIFEVAEVICTTPSA